MECPHTCLVAGDQMQDYPLEVGSKWKRPTDQGRTAGRPAADALSYVLIQREDRNTTGGNNCLVLFWASCKTTLGTLY